MSNEITCYQICNNKYSAMDP